MAKRLSECKIKLIFTKCQKKRNTFIINFRWSIKKTIESKMVCIYITIITNV